MAKETERAPSQQLEICENSTAVVRNLFQTDTSQAADVFIGSHQEFLNLAHPAYWRTSTALKTQTILQEAVATSRWFWDLPNIQKTAQQITDNLTYLLMAQAPKIVDTTRSRDPQIAAVGMRSLHTLITYESNPEARVQLAKHMSGNYYPWILNHFVRPETQMLATPFLGLLLEYGEPQIQDAAHIVAAQMIEKNPDTAPQFFGELFDTECWMRAQNSAELLRYYLEGTQLNVRNLLHFWRISGAFQRTAIRENLKAINRLETTDPGLATRLQKSNNLHYFYRYSPAYLRWLDEEQKSPNPNHIAAFIGAFDHNHFCAHTNWLDTFNDQYGKEMGVRAYEIADWHDLRRVTRTFTSIPKLVVLQIHGNRFNVRAGYDSSLGTFYARDLTPEIISSINQTVGDKTPVVVFSCETAQGILNELAQALPNHPFYGSAHQANQLEIELDETNDPPFAVLIDGQPATECRYQPQNTQAVLAEI